MVLEGPFDDLVKEVRRYKLVNVGSWKIVCEWLQEMKLAIEVLETDVKW